MGVNSFLALKGDPDLNIYYPYAVEHYCFPIPKELLIDKIIALHINRFERTEPLSSQMHRSCQYAYFRLKSWTSSRKEQHFDGTYCGRTSETLTLKGLAKYNSSDHG